MLPLVVSFGANEAHNFSSFCYLSYLMKIEISRHGLSFVNGSCLSVIQHKPFVVFLCLWWRCCCKSLPVHQFLHSPHCYVCMISAIFGGLRDPALLKYNSLICYCLCVPEALSQQLFLLCSFQNLIQ